MDDAAREQEDRDERIRQLTTLMAAGSESAFAAFYKLVFDRLFHAILVRTCGNEELGKEVMQAVFLRVVRHKGPFPNERALWGWLRQVAHSCHVDLLRKSGREPATIPLELFNDRVAAEDVAEQSRLLKALDESLTRLDTAERELLHLAYFEGVRHQEIATRLDTTSKAVESRLARAREKLKRLLLQVLNDYALF